MKTKQETILNNTNLDNKHLFLYDNVDSTMNIAQNGRWNGFNLIVADSQQNGRGQREHSFYSPDSGIYMTIVTPVKKIFLKNPGLLTIGIGVATNQAIKNVLGIKIALKWVNDIYFKNKKCGGILVEIKSNDQNEPQNLLLGIGIDLVNNSVLKRNNYVGLTNDSLVKNKLIAEIYNFIGAFFENPNAKIVKRSFEANMLWKNKFVTIENGNEKLMGKIKGINKDFELILDQNGSELTLNPSETKHMRLMQ